MPAIGSITIADGASPVVTRTFSPVGFTDLETAKFEDRSPIVQEGFPVIRVTTRRSSSKNSGQRVKFQLDLPVLAQTAPSTSTGIQPNPSVAYTLIGTAEFVLPKSCTLQDRKNVLALLKNGLATSLVTAGVENLDPPY